MRWRRRRRAPSARRNGATVSDGKRRLGIFVRAGISVALLGLMLWYLDAGGEVLELFSGAAPHLFAAAFVVLTLDRLLMTYKWIVLLKARRQRLGVYRGFKIYCAAMIWGMFMPATIGADALRAWLTTKTGVDGYEVTASIVIERVVGFIAALVVGLGGLVILDVAGAVDEHFDPVWWGGGALIAAAIALLLLSFNQALFERVLAFIPQRLTRLRITGKLAQLHAVYRGYARERSALIRFTALTVVEQGMAIIATWLLSRGLGVDVAFWFVAAAVPLAMLVARLPIAFDGIGVYETAFVLLMGLVGVGAAEALSIALAGRLVQTLAFLPWWFLYTLGESGRGAARAPSATA